MIVPVDRHELIRSVVSDGGFRDFVRIFYGVADPATRKFVDGWHIGAICEFLTAAYNREIRRFVINVPPGTGKSTLVSVLWPAWIWTLDPRHRFMFASFDIHLALRDARRHLDVISSESFTGAWPDFRIGHGVKAAQVFGNAHGGVRYSTSIGGGGTGWHADIQVCDDPHKQLDAYRPDALARAANWWQGTMSTRHADPDSFVRGIIMQRIAKPDLAGVCLEDGYAHLCLPMQWAPRHWSEWSERLDQRNEPGESIDSVRFTMKAIEDLKRALKSPAARSAQLEQDPTPDTGGILERDWFRYRWPEIPKGARVVQSWDFNFKGSNESHSRVCGQLWAEREGICYLIDEVRGLWNYPEAKRQCVAAQYRPGWSGAATKLIEEKANGIAIIDELEEGILDDTGKRIRIAGIKRVSPKDDKVTRLIAHSDHFESGAVRLPIGSGWVDEYIAEMVAFPRGSCDDRVDVTTQALDHLLSKQGAYYESLRKLSSAGR